MPCQRVGICCNDGELRCQWLRGEVGKVGGCTCAVYDQRYDQMLIFMLNPAGEPVKVDYCVNFSNPWPECCSVYCQPSQEERQLAQEKVGDASAAR